MIDKILLFFGWKKRGMHGELYIDKIKMLFDATIVLFLVWVVMAIKNW